MEEKFILCPICNNKTRTKIRQDTEAKRLPVFCPKCHRTFMMDIDKGEYRIPEE